MNSVTLFESGEIRNRDFMHDFIFRGTTAVFVTSGIWIVYGIVQDYVFTRRLTGIVNLLLSIVIYSFLKKNQLDRARILFLVLINVNIFLSIFEPGGHLIYLFAPMIPVMIASAIIFGKKGLYLSTVVALIQTSISMYREVNMLNGNNYEFSNYFLIYTVLILSSLVALWTLHILDKSIERISDNQLNYKILMEESPDSISIVSINGNVIDVNSTFERYTGIRRDEIIGTDGSMFLDKSDRDVILKHFRETRDTGKSISHSYLLKNGEKYYFELVGKRLPDNRILHQLRDITEKIKAEEKYRQAEEVLINSQKFELVGRLAGQVAHDFNNILTAILNYAEITIMDIDDGNIDRTTIEQIRDITYRGTSIAKSLLSTTSQKIPDFNPLNVNQEILDRQGMLKAILGPTIELEINLEKDLPNIVGDETQFEQILLNVILNGKDAIESNGKIIIETKMEMIRPTLNEIILKTNSTHPLSRYLCLSISDTGSGMNENIIDKIFEAFYTKKGRGTGLGLYIVHSIMDLCNGHIMVESKLGVGSTFKFYFPPTDAQIENQNLIKVTPPTWLKNVLIVEDQGEVRESMARSFEKYKIKVKTAENGAKAQNIIKSNGSHFDLIITDLVMPELRGDEFLIWFRTVNSTSKAILMSAYDFQLPLLKIHFASDKLTAVMTKPFIISELFQLLNEEEFQ